eukprot:2753840-Amphidinium_carterae.1
MLQAPGDGQKWQREACPGDRGDARHSSGQELARPSPKRGGERVPAHRLSAVAETKAVALRALTVI